MARIHGDILIERPVEAVFDFVADERNEPRFNPQMATSSLESDEPIGEGSRFRTTFRSVGRLVPMTVEFTGYERPYRLGSRSRMRAMLTEGELTFEPESSGTRMRWSWDVQVRGPLRFADALVARMGDCQERRIWGNLKALLEEEEPGAVEPGTRPDGPGRYWRPRRHCQVDRDRQHRTLGDRTDHPWLPFLGVTYSPTAPRLPAPRRSRGLCVANLRSPFLVTRSPGWGPPRQLTSRRWPPRASADPGAARTARGSSGTPQAGQSM